MSPKVMKYGRSLFLSAVGLALTFLVVESAAAAEPVSTGRKIWDMLMMFVNFGILVFLFIRYARKPLMDYLHQTREKIGHELNTVRDRLEQTRSERDAEASKLETIEQQLHEIQESILEMARLEKERIIEEGRRVAEKMVQDAEKYSTYKMSRAKKAIRDQMVDLAVTMAEDRLLKKMTEEDNQRLVEQFIQNLPSSPTEKSK